MYFDRPRPRFNPLTLRPHRIINVIINLKNIKYDIFYLCFLIYGCFYFFISETLEDVILLQI